MRRDDPHDHAALSRHWDGIAGNDPVASADLPRDLAATVDTLHRLDRAPAPRPEFVDQLEKELMTTVAPSHALPLSGVVSSNVASLNGRGGPVSRPLDRVLPRRHLAGLAAAAVVLLAVASGILAYQLAPSNGDDDPHRGAFNAPAPATPAANQPGPDECQVSPAPLERLALTGTPSVEAAVPLDFETHEENWGVSVDDLPSGEAVDAETLGAITATVREFIACESADDPARASALFTDDYWRRLHQKGATPDPARLSTFALFGLRLIPNEPPSMPTVEDARLLPDGTVGAVVETNFFSVFRLVGDRWLIDEVAAFNRTNAFEVEIVVTDSGFEPAEVRLPGIMWDLVIRNEGTKTHSFVVEGIPDRLVLAPGQSEAFDLGLQLQPGTYEFSSDLTGDREAGLVGTLIIEGEPLATPDPSPEAGEELATEVTVDLIDIVFEPAILTIPANTLVTVHLKNRGAAMHDFTIEELGIAETLMPGTESTITINLPAGDYEYICTQHGHREAGMVGSLFVREID